MFKTGFIAILFLTPLWAFALEVYVVDAGPNRSAPFQVLKFDENGQNPQVFINTQLNRPQDIVFLDDGETALVSNLGSNKITRYNAETGQYLGDFAVNPVQPTRMKIGDDGLLYVVQWAGNGRVLRYRQDGVFVDEYTVFGVTQGIGIDWDAQGDLYVSSFDTRNVRRFDSGGNNIGPFISTALNGPTNVLFKDDGELLVLDWSGVSVNRYDSNGNFIDQFMTGLRNPEGIAVLPNGDYLVGNGGTSSVRQYDKNGTYRKEFITSGAGNLATPVAIVLRETGVPITTGMNDAWFNPATPGQGFFVTVLPSSGLMFAAWFTFDTERPPEDVAAILGEPGHRWLTAQGPYDGNRAELTVFLTTGGVFDSTGPVPETDPDGDGTLVFEFESCMNGTVIYDIESADISGTFPIQRVSSDNEALCEIMAESVVQ